MLCAAEMWMGKAQRKAKKISLKKKDHWDKKKLTDGHVKIDTECWNWIKPGRMFRKMLEYDTICNTIKYI